MQLNQKSNDCRFMPRHSRHCVGCPLDSARIRHKNVPTELFHVKDAESDDIDVLFLGEAPGEQEDAEGRPFVGKSGKFVKSYIDKYANANYAIGNVVRCLEGSTLVHLEDGSWCRIDDLVRTKYKGRVWSVVDDSNQLVLRAVTNWYASKLGNRTLYKIACPELPSKGGRARRSIVTNDHEVKTTRGWVRAEDLIDGDQICLGDGLSRVAKDILFGSLLGDGSMANSSSHLEIRHGVAQKEWCDLKGKALQELGSVYGSIKHRTIRGGDYTNLRTASTNALALYKKEFYPKGTRSFPEWLKLNSRILAVWFLDNGYTKIRPNRQPSAEIACHSLPDAKIDILIRQLNSMWGFHAYRGKRTNRKRIYFNVADTRILAAIIAPFTPKSMRYKLHPQVEQQYPFDAELYRPGPRTSLYTQITVKKSVLGKPRLKKSGEPRSNSGNKQVYCIDVDDTHNFVTPAGVVHNCRPVDSEGHNRQPTPEERAHCIKYTIEQIDQLKPKKIVALGGVSAGAFLDRFRSVASIRGQEIPIKVKSKQSKDGWFHTKLCPTYHPAARDLYQLSFLPKDIFRTFRGFGKRQWDAPGKDHVVAELSKVRKLLRHIATGLDRGDIVAIDVETLNGVDRLNNSVISIAFSWDGVNGYSIPLDHPKSPWTAEEFLLIKKWLRRLFTKPVSFGYWLAHNTKFELQQLHLYLGVWARNRPWLDTMLIAFLLDENRLSMSKQMKPFNLKQLSAEELNLPYDESSLAEVIGARDEGQIQKLPWRSVCRYNCLDYRVPVILEDGSTMKIGELVLKKAKVKVLSYGPNGIEAKPVVNWLHNYEPHQSWVQIKLEGIPSNKSRQLIVTPEHGVFTTRGKIRADRVKVGDCVIINEPLLTDYEQSAILGSLLGDACLVTSPSQRKNWRTAYACALSCSHVEKSGIAQWKIATLSELISSTGRRSGGKFTWSTTGKSYTAKPSINFKTRNMQQLAGVEKLCYEHKNGSRIKRITRDWLDLLTPVSLAWWFMDDGFKNHKCVALSTNGFDQRSHALLEDWATAEFGDCYVDKYGVLRFSLAATQKFCQVIAPHLPKPARYKLPTGQWPAYTPYAPPKTRQAHAAKVQHVGAYSHSRTTKEARYVADHNFCIEVADNHNFFTPFGLVSNCTDAWRTRRLLDKFEWNAGDYWVKAMRISLEIFSPALFMFAAAELNGFQIDIDRLFELQSPNSPLVLAMQEIDTAFRSNPDVIKVNKKLANDATGGMRPLFGSAWVFNPNKKAHLIELFVKHLKLPPLKWGKKPKDPKKKPEPSLDSDYFTFYNDRHPLAKKMNERQEIKKMATSFLDQIREFLEHNPECKDGRVRPQFHMGRTVTGRTACTNPNLQQIPRADTSYKKATKNIFTVKPGNVLVSADIAQGEVFLMAQTTGDLVFAKALHYMKRIKEQYWREPNSELKTILKNECDVHRQSASILYGVPIDKVTKEQRNLAKSIVTFGIIYGKAIKTIAEDLKISEKEAEKVQAKFFAKFKGSRDGLLRLEQMAKRFGFVESCIGRRRRLPQVKSEDQGEVARALRQARNSPIQSLLSDYTLFQAGKLHQYILDHNKNWKIVDAVHDAVIAEIPFHEVRDYVKVARRIMMDVESFAKAFEIQMIVPMLVDIDVGISYGDLTTAETWSEGPDSLRAALKAIRKAWEDQGYSVDLPMESELAAAA